MRTSARRRALLALSPLVLIAGCERPFLGPTPTAERSASLNTVAPYSAVRATEWDTLFDRRSGWTGGDGAYSVPLSGDERPGTAEATRTLWLFSDTFIGEVGDDDSRLPGSTLINNTIARLTGGQPLPERTEFFWRTDASGQPEAQVRPNTDPTHWFWPADGLVVDGTVYMYALEMRRGGSGVFNFETVGVSVLTDRADSPVPFAAYTQVNNTPLFEPGSPTMTFGVAVMPNTAAAGAPHPDGYVYVYGTRDNPLNKQLVAARVPPNAVADFSAYRYWDGRRWNRLARKAAPVTDRISAGFSVSPLSDGRFLLVFQLDALSRDVAVRYGESPIGPWGAPISVWRAPEPDLDPDIYTYNALGHPHLSQAGELLISYNVNTFEFGDHFRSADIYRPRFIRLPLD